MRTEEDLRYALRSLEPDGPQTRALLDRVRTGAARRRRARIAGTVAASVVVIGAVAVVAPVATHRLTNTTAGPSAGPTSARPGAPTPTIPTPPITGSTPGGGMLRFHFDLATVPHYVMTSFRIVPGVQTVNIARDTDTGKVTGDLVVYDPGKYDPGPAKRGTPVEVNGKRGYYAKVVDQDTVVPGVPGGAIKQYAVTWEYAPNAWAIVQGEWSPATARAQELTIARAVRFDRTRPFLVPFRFGWAPPSLRVFAGQFGVNPEFVNAAISLTDLAGVPASAPPPSILGDQSVRVLLAPDSTSGALQPNTTIGGDRAFVDTRMVAVWHDGFLLTLHLGSRSGPTTVATLRRVVEHLVWAPRVGDIGTWLDGTTFIP
jgi:hypothetical protein